MCRLTVVTDICFVTVKENALAGFNMGISHQEGLELSPVNVLCEGREAGAPGYRHARANMERKQIPPVG